MLQNSQKGQVVTLARLLDDKHAGLLVIRSTIQCSPPIYLLLPSCKADTISSKIDDQIEPPPALLHSLLGTTPAMRSTCLGIISLLDEVPRQASLVSANRWLLISKTMLVDMSTRG